MGTARKPMASALAALALSILAACTLLAGQAQASEFSIEQGVDRAVAQVCAMAADHGDELLEAQAAMVGDDLAAITERNAAQAAQAAAAAHPAASPQPPAASGPRTIDVDGTAMGFTDAFQASTAPSTGAGLWMGSDSTTDGTWGYFIGHNPGPFWHVMDLATGDAVTVTDSAGASRTYHVVDVFTVPDSTYWEEIQGRVTGYGESVILQTCCGDHANYRVVVAA